MTNYKYVNVLKVEPGQTENRNKINTPFSKSLSEWTKTVVYQDAECSIVLDKHTSGFKMRTYSTANVIVTETNWELESTGPNEVTPKQP